MSDLIRDLVIGILWWMILFPVVCILATPVILILVRSGKPGMYFRDVAKKYRAVTNFWLEHGMLFF